MSRRRHSKHGRKRPNSIAPPDHQSIGQDDVGVSGIVSPDPDGSATAVARLSGETPAAGDGDGSRRSPPSGIHPAEPSSGARPKTPAPIDPDAPTSVLPASELPARSGLASAPNGRPSGAVSHSGDSGSRARVTGGDATGYFARQPTPQPGEAVAVPKICPHCGGEYETDARFCPKDGTALRPKGGGDALIGRVIADRYHVLKVVGEGGMGRIYLAEHVRMNRQCALKVMRPNLVHDADSAARFGREASNAARIIHPNVAAVFDYGETEGLVYLVMEYVEGDPLGEILQKGGALAPQRAVEIAKQVTDALTAAHELGIVHRDLKPDNIIVTKAKSGREVAKVVDFGIAKAIAESPDRRLTETGLVIGTPEFMSPEQLVGDPADARSDIYSLGCIFYLMLVGSPAADAPTRDAMLKRRLNELPPHPSSAKNDLPPELDAIVVKMLAVSPADRFQSAMDLRAALDQVRLAPDPDAPVTSGGIAAPPRISTDPSKAPTVEVPALAPLPAWAPEWLGRPRVRRAVRTAAIVAGVALVGGAAVGALTVAMRPSRAGPAAALATRPDSVALSGRSPAPSGLTTGASTGAASPRAEKSGVRTTGAPVAARGEPTPARSATTSGRTRLDSTPSGSPPVDRRERVALEANIPAPIRLFRDAVRSGDVERIKQAYPSMPDKQRSGWQKLFESSKPERAEITSVVGRQPFDAAGTAVDFVLAVRFRDPVGTTVTWRRGYRAILRREGPTVVLQSLTELGAAR